MAAANVGKSKRIDWLRTAVFGANDGILSTASLVIGVAGLVAGSTSMAAGEYLSVIQRQTKDYPGLP